MKKRRDNVPSFRAKKNHRPYMKGRFPGKAAFGPGRSKQMLRNPLRQRCVRFPHSSNSCHEEKAAEELG